jgi:hypothetical protein
MKKHGYFTPKRGTLTGLSKKDAFYPDRDRLIGMKGTFKRGTSYVKFFSSGTFQTDDGVIYSFYAAQFKED